MLKQFVVRVLRVFSRIGVDGSRKLVIEYSWYKPQILQADCSYRIVKSSDTLIVQSAILLQCWIRYARTQ